MPLSFRQLFALFFTAGAILLAASYLSAWTGPSAAAPSGNVSAPVNVGTTDQVKNGGLSVDAFAVFGSQYIADALGIGRESPVVALDVNGTLRLADGGELCQAVSEGAIRYTTATNVVEYCDGTSWISLGGSSAGAIPSGAVMAFDLTACPSGWTEYTPAYGRFIRGIDKSGTSIDPSGQRAAGSTQADELRSHTHAFADDYPAYAGTLGGESTAGYYPTNAVDTTWSTGGAETRPKNVALLYCEKS